MSLRSFIVLLCLIQARIVLHSQDLSATLPKIIPPSPEAAAFARYGEIPVDFSTGVPSISVPIYTIKSGKLELPLSISYHSSGIKVRDKASIVGLGWVLNAQGMVSRTILGYPDELRSIQGNGKSPYPTKAQIDSLIGSVTINSQNGDGNASELKLIHENYYDQYSDRYAYNFNKHAGIFRFNFLNDSIRTTPYAPIVITKVGTENSTRFKIIDENGISYFFDSTETSSNVGGGGISSWLLTKIVTADSANEIKFHYSAGEVITDYAAAQTIMSGDYYTANVQAACPSFSGPFYDLSFSNNLTATQHATKKLDSITSELSVVHFSYLNDRVDGRTTRIKEIRVIDRKTRTVINYIRFYQAYFGTQASDRRMRLDSLSIYGSDTTLFPQKYQFNYNLSIPLPPVYSNTPNEGFAEDYWGYYNGGSGNSYIPYEFLSFFPASRSADRTYYGGNLNPNEYLMQTCMLNSITYPTGGKTLFEFESNKTGPGFYGYTNSNNGLIGGLRIKAIKNISTTGLPDTIVKSYKYSLNGATIPIQANLYYYQQVYEWMILLTNDFCLFADSRPTTKDIAISTPLFPLSVRNQSPILYYEVTEYDGKDSISSNGKTIFQYRLPDNYSYTTEDIDRPRLISMFHFDRGMNGCSLAKKIVYKNANGVYTPIKITNNTYSYISKPTVHTGLKLDRIKTYVALVDPKLYMSAYNYVNEFIYDDTKAYPDVLILQQTTDTLFEGISGYQATTTLYSYDSVTLLPTAEKKIVTTGDTLATIFKYPYDFKNTSPYSTMISKNVLTSLIQKSTYRNSIHLSTIKSNYANWGNNIFEPSTVETHTLTNSPEISIRYHAYDDKGNILTVSKENDIKHSYIWDYGKMRPIADVANADNASIAYTSFEAEGKGNWTFSGTPNMDPTTPTGKMCYSLSGGAVQKTGLTSGSSYILSYWYKSGASITITGGTQTDIVSGYSKSSWTYTQRKVTGTTSVSLSGSGYIDELRVYPANAQMTTYTYDPLVGLTSQCDIGNRITYYEYDASNRLVVVRNWDSNIVKRICYNLAGQPENCTAYTNGVKTSAKFRNNCGMDYVGSQSTYTVPAGTYASTTSQVAADAFAQSDVSTNSQTYANTNGSCTACSGSYTPESGWYIVTGSPTANSSSVSINIVLVATSSSSWDNISSQGRYIATLPACFRPSGERYLTFLESGRVWSVTVYPNGQILLVRTGGAALPGVNSPFQLSGQSYNL